MTAIGKRGGTHRMAGALLGVGLAGAAVLGGIAAFLMVWALPAGVVG